LSFKKPDLTLIQSKRRLVMAVWGQEKVGKTTFALSFPEPIRFIDWNYGTEGLEKWYQDKAVEFARYGVTPLSTNKEVADAVKEFQADYMSSLKFCAPEGGTVVVDTGSELYDNVQRAKLEELHQRKYEGKDDWAPMAFDYGEVNSFMSSVYLAPLQMPGVNVVIVHKCKDEYQGKDRTGRLMIDGWKGTTGAVQVTAQAVKEMTRDGRPEFKLKINTCRLDPALETQTLPNASYDFLMANIG
jgi:hypothetical protein